MSKQVFEGPDPLGAAVESAQRVVGSLATYIEAAQAVEDYIVSLQTELVAVDVVDNEESLAQTANLPQPVPPPLNLRERLSNLFDGNLDTLVDNFLLDWQYGNVNLYAFEAFVTLAEGGDQRARGVVYALMLSGLQGDEWETFEVVTGLIFFGPEGNYKEDFLGGNCANFASQVLNVIGLAQTHDMAGIEGLDWERFEDFQQYYSEGKFHEASDAWTSADTLFDHLKRRAPVDADVDLVVWDAGGAHLVNEDYWYSEPRDLHREEILQYGDLVFYGTDPQYHVAVIIGWGRDDTPGDYFYPTYEEAVRNVAAMEVGIDTEGIATSDLAARLRDEFGIRIVPWQVDHSGFDGDVLVPYPRPVSNPDYYVHIEFTGGQ